jgi:hypothetical protein
VKEVHWSDKSMAMHKGSALDEVAAVHEAAAYERTVPAMDERIDMRAAESTSADPARTHPSDASSVSHHRHPAAVETTAAAVETTAATAVETTAAPAVETTAAPALREGRRRAAEQQGCTAYRHQHS